MKPPTFLPENAMTQVIQNYANHRRFFPLFHYVALPIVVLNAGVATVDLARHPTLRSGWALVLSVGIAAGFLAFRTMAVTVQNRLIGLEMRLRLAAVLPPEQRTRIPELGLRLLIGLRFASDNEISALVARCLAGELQTADQVKREIREWRPDFVRA
jgi:hypothetical protein